MKFAGNNVNVYDLHSYVMLLEQQQQKKALTGTRALTRSSAPASQRSGFQTHSGLQFSTVKFKYKFKFKLSFKLKYITSTVYII